MSWKRDAASRVRPTPDGLDVINESGYAIRIINIRVDERQRVWLAFELCGRRWYRAPDGSLH